MSLIDDHPLIPGDGTVGSSFKKVLRAADGKDILSMTFKPKRGYEFVSVYLGMVKKGDTVDIDAMLERLGYVPK